jgi:uncharacterized protein (TIGR00290 family)
MAPKIILSWSSGKDSAFTLQVLKANGIHVAGLLTTVNEAFDRVAMHAVRRELLEEQARATGLELHMVNIPYPCSNEEYESKMATFVDVARSEGVTHFAFGDLFLEDIRRYREDKLRGTGLGAMFPLWGRPTPALAREMLELGLVAHVTCVDPKKLDKSFVGARYDENFLRALPSDVDPCGENGEFHTFVSNGPMFSRPIDIEVGEVVERDGFVFADIRRAPRVSVDARL